MTVTANSIITPQGTRAANCVCTAAQATFPPTTAPSNTVSLFTAGANGSRITKLNATPQETVTAATLQIFRSRDAGVTKYFFASATCGSDTVSATDGPTTVDFGFSDDNPLILAANEVLYAAVGVAKTWVFNAEGADY